MFKLNNFITTLEFIQGFQQTEKCVFMQTTFINEL